MATVFVSHSSRDGPVTEWVVAQLRAAGFAALFVDFDPEDGIPAGRNWERELHARLRSSDGVVFLASEASVDSRWCFAELSLARSLGRPVFPVRLQPGTALPLLADVQWSDLTDPEAGLARLLAGLHSAGLDPADSFAWDPARSPYPGLTPFAPEDAAVFFGRQQETHRLQELLTPTLEHGSGRFVAVVGPSGSGKSSLVHAGLLPRLARMPQRWLVLPPLRPGRQPTANLAGSLARAFTARGHPRPVEDVATVLAQGSAGLVELAGQLVDLAGDGAGRPGALVVIDQAEELLTRTGAREQQAFLELLSGALHEDSPVWAVATVRSEFLSRSPERVSLTEVIDDALVVEPLSRARLPEVIARPARRAGLEFEPGLIERIVEDTTGGDAVSLLAYTLHELAQRAGPDGVISATDYEAVGGVVGALRRRADLLVDELSRRGLGEAIVPTLLKLATVDEGGEPVSRRIRRSALSSTEQTIVDAFIGSRLVMSDRSGQSGEEPTVEVAHEALLRQWPPLHDAIEESRDSMRLRADLDRHAADWHAGGRDDSYLPRGSRLALFEDWAQEHPDQLGALEQEFLSASRALRGRSLRRLRAVAGGLGVLLIIALIAAGLAVHQSREADAERRLALSRQLAIQSASMVDSRPELAVLVGLESLSIAHDQRPQPSSGLVTGLSRLTHASTLLTGHTGHVNDVTFSRDGTLLASADDDGTVRLWDAATGRPRGEPFTGHSGVVHAVAFSPDGTLLASAGADGSVRLWDVRTGRPHGNPLEGHLGEEVWAVAFSPDGRSLATAGGDRMARLWDVARGQPAGEPLSGHTDTVYSVDFHPDGTLLATGSWDHTVRFWSPSTGRPHGDPLTGHTHEVQNVAFSPDGTVLASASVDQTVRIWDVSTGQPRGGPLLGHTGTVHGVDFSPDGALLASASADEKVRLWNAATGQPVSQPLVRHTNQVRDLAFSPDGTVIASASWDKTVRLWKVAEDPSVSRPLPGHTDYVWGVAFDPRHNRLATTSGDHTVRLWDVATGQPFGQPLTGHTDDVYGAAFSPDGTMLATSGDDGTVRLWDTASGKSRGQPLSGHTDTVHGVAFSPDGDLLASASWDATVRLWDVASGTSVGEPLEHDNDVIHVTFNPAGTLLASSSADATIRLWDVKTGGLHGEPLAGHNGYVWQSVFSSDGGLLASASEDGTVRLWDVHEGRQDGAPLTGHTGAVFGVAFNSDGTLLASASADRTARLWNVRTRQQQGPPLSGHGDAVRGVAFNRDGTLLASTSDDRYIRLWDVRLSSWSGRSWADAGCEIINRNLTRDEWDELVQGIPYQRTCPDLPAGAGAPREAPAAEYQ